VVVQKTRREERPEPVFEKRTGIHGGKLGTSNVGDGVQNHGRRHIRKHILFDFLFILKVHKEFVSIHDFGHPPHFHHKSDVCARFCMLFVLKLVIHPSVVGFVFQESCHVTSIAHRYSRAVLAFLHKDRDGVQRLLEEFPSGALLRDLTLLGGAPEIRKLVRVLVVFDIGFPTQKEVQELVRRP
jgi:hypothetical protein